MGQYTQYVQYVPPLQPLARPCPGAQLRKDCLPSITSGPVKPLYVYVYMYDSEYCMMVMMMNDIIMIMTMMYDNYNDENVAINYDDYDADDFYDIANYEYYKYDDTYAGLE